MPYRLRCPFCSKTGFVRVEQVIKGSRTTLAYYCGGCEETWQVVAESFDTQRVRQARLAGREFEHAHAMGMERLKQADYAGVKQALEREAEAIQRFNEATTRSKKTRVRLPPHSQ